MLGSFEIIACCYIISQGLYNRINTTIRHQKNRLVYTQYSIVAYLIRPSSAKEAMRNRAVSQVDGLVEHRDGLCMPTLALEQLRQGKIYYERVVLFIDEMRCQALFYGRMRRLVLPRVNLSLREKEQLRAQGDVVRNELSRVFGQT